MTLWLRYIDYEIDPDPVDWRFDARAEYDRPDVERLRGRTLRGVGYSHRLSRRRVWEVSIGADQLFVTAARDFIDAFWWADRIFISTTNSLTVPLDADFVEFDPPEGTSPMEFLEGAREFPSLTLTLTEKYAR